MYVQPVGINLLAQAGYGNIGIYLRYSTYGLFQKEQGTGSISLFIWRGMVSVIPPL